MVARLTGHTPRTARTVAGRYPTFTFPLPTADVLAFWVAAAVTVHSPPAQSQARKAEFLTDQRDTNVIQIARQIWQSYMSGADVSGQVVVVAPGWAVVRSVGDVPAVLSELGDTEVAVVLPVGRWAGVLAQRIEVL